MNYEPKVGDTWKNQGMTLTVTRATATGWFEVNGAGYYMDSGAPERFGWKRDDDGQHR